MELISDIRQHGVDQMMIRFNVVLCRFRGLVVVNSILSRFKSPHSVTCSLHINRMTVGDVSGVSQVKAPLKELSPLPEYLDHRIKLWDEFKAAFQAELATKEVKLIKITVTDKDGNVKQLDDLESWKSTPLDAAKKVGSKSWVESIIISKVNGKLWDLERPLEDDCSIELIKFDDDQGM